MTRLLGLLAASFLVVASACGSNGGGSGDDAGDDTTIDADPNAPDSYGSGGDGGGPGGCVENGAQCNNCVDDDGDGQIDGFDIECASPLDNDEGSFATGIPGDNIDSTKQDCFFDGNSGAGDDGCDMHSCCLLGLTAQECSDAGFSGNYNPDTDCDISPDCIEYCAPLTPPGCDCFGCCTVCDDQGCRDIITNPAIAPDCDADTLHDETACPACVKVEACGEECNPEGCILCPGQDESDLPPECTDNVCPGGGTSCESNADCSETEFCSVGCCVAVVD